MILLQHERRCFIILRIKLNVLITFVLLLSLYLFQNHHVKAEIVVYQYGDVSLGVIELKENLKTLGFLDLPNPNEYFGVQTKAAVENFQEYFNLEVDGIAGPQTQNKITEVLDSPFQNGRRHQDIIQLKKDLDFLGYKAFTNPTTYYGVQTKELVESFQKDYGLPVSGIPDSVTRAKIKELVKGPMFNGLRRDDVISLKRNLVKLGFASFTNPTNLYGPQTEKAVRDFQSYYKLAVTGVADKDTVNRLEDIAESPFQNGRRHNDTIQLKKDLDFLGYKAFTNPTTYYGVQTKESVESFQKDYGLPASGIADSVTRAKIKVLVEGPMFNGLRRDDVIQLKRDLVQLGFGDFKNPTNLYGPRTESAVREFQKEYGLTVDGIAGPETVAKIKELVGPAEGETTYTNYGITLSEAINIQMNQMAQTDKGEYAWVSKTYIDSNNRVTASALNVRTQPTTSNEMGNRILGTLSKGTKVEIIDQKGNWYAIKYNNSSWVHAVREDVRYYLNPNNFINDNRQKFQFLDLSKPSGASRSVLNNYLKDRDVLANQGQAFIDAARKHGVNDIYLISHSVLETGHGTSTLAKGVEVGVNKDGKPVLVTKSNRKSLKNIKTVYNMYGIGAVDSNPLGGGAIRAYNEGWDTVEKAIIGGAKFIGNSYIKNGQNTLYKMRWNPKMNEGMAWKQYATDIGWASKQVHTMYNLYQEIGHNNPILDIPVYK